MIEVSPIRDVRRENELFRRIQNPRDARAAYEPSVGAAYLMGIRTQCRSQPEFARFSPCLLRTRICGLQSGRTRRFDGDINFDIHTQIVVRHAFP